MDDALRQPRGAGGVHDVDHVVVGCADFRLGIARGVSECPVVRAEKGDLAVRDLQPIVDIGLVATTVQLGHGVDEVVVEDQPRRTAVLQDELQLVRHKAPVQGHDHRTDLAEGEEQLHELGAVHEQEGDPLALLDARCAERVGRTIGTCVEFGEGQALAAIPVDVGLPLRHQKGALGEPPADVVFHASSVDDDPRRALYAVFQHG